ncbi:MAG: hypothetical protein JZU47_18845 [Prolixibacteraceae bacterium]|nr:hypothetical protein [Prolixibacteraceae bacterium]
MKKKILTLFLLCFQISVFAQQAGLPFITNYPPEEYKGTSQNWAIVQDNRGVMFFGNSNGVFEFDGIEWRFITMPNTVRSLAIDSAGCVFVGSNGDFGYLHPDSLGTYQFRSLKEKIPQQHREFNDVWNIFVSKNQVYFQTFEKIFIYQNEKFEVIYPDKSFHLSFLVNDSFYVREVGKGLMILKNDSLQLIKGGERFADEKIYAMLPFGDNEILIATRTQGIFIYSPQKDNPISKPAGFEAVDKFVVQNLAYCGNMLGSGNFALGTLTGGIIAFNSAGRIQSIYNANSGLQDNSIRKLFYDNNQQLWAALNNGISLVQSNLPFQLFTEKNGLKGFPMCIYFFNNRLYVGTSQHLCVQNPDGNFEIIPGTEGQNWQLYNANGTLLLADLNGLFEIKDNQAIQLIKNHAFISLTPFYNKQNYLLAGLDAGDGLCLLEYKQKTWNLKNTIKGFSKFAYTVVHDKDESIWVHTNPGLYKLKLNESLDSAISVMNYSTEHGLPPDYAVPCLLHSGELIFVTTKGIYRYLPATDNFEQHPAFKMITGTVYPFQEQKNGDIWFQEVTGNGIYEKGVLKHNKGEYQLYKQAFYKFNNYLNSADHNFHLASDSVMFIGTTKGLLQYNPSQKVDYNIPFHTLIRKVFVKDSLVFGGAIINENDFEHIKGAEFSYRQNNLVFHYTAAFYEDVERNLYSYRLLGSDTTWSAWVSDVKKEYTNLSEGNYTFEVKSKNQYKVTGKTAKYSFRILPPWHHTWWAFLLYFILFIAFIYFTIKLYTRRLVAQKEHLEEVVNERTAEVVQQKEEIQIQKNELEVANATKDQFFKIISHDLRNPFNSLVGFSELLIEEIEQKDFEKSREYAKSLQKSSNELYSLTTNLLNWSRAQTNEISFNPEQLNIRTEIDSNVNFLKNFADKKGIILSSTPENDIFIFADQNMLNTVLRNLITNAIKFSRKDDKITVEVEELETLVVVHIADTGIGMEKPTLEKLFKIGENIKSQGTAHEPGTGLGLILCKEFIDKHNGKIWVDSEKGKGSRFSFTMKKYKA